MTGTTAITKVDIFTITGLTLTDGSILDTGAVLKLATEFPIGFNGFMFDILPYRSLAIFKAGYRPVEIMNFDNSGQYDLGTEFGSVDMMTVYSLVADFINGQYDSDVCEVVVYDEPVE
jgi:hypothetical protein